MLAGSSPSPRLLLLGSVWLIASCAALGLSASSRPAAAPAKTVAKQAHPTPAAAPRPVATKAHPPCSDDMALVGSSCVDRYEAHLLEEQADGSLKAHPAWERPEQKRYVAASRAGIKPQGFISQIQAASACENAGKRLCQLTEWYRACTGPEKTTYPYGATYQKGRCNVGKTHLLSELYGANANLWSYDAFNDPQLAKRPGFLDHSSERVEVHLM